MFIKQLSIFMENKAGRMAEISRILADGGVNIRALSVADTTGFGILRLIVDDPEKAERVCRAAGLTTALTDAIAISMDDRPGGFADVMETVAEAKTSVEYMYAFLTLRMTPVPALLCAPRTASALCACCAKRGSPF